MDVTEEILLQNIIYGSSDNTNPNGLASSRSLNYAIGPSISRPDTAKIELIPYTLKFESAVGPFGTDNYFCKVTVRLDPIYAAKCYEDEGWECARIQNVEDYAPGWNQADIQQFKDTETVNTYDPANISFELVQRPDAYLSVDLENLKTGNHFIDAWVSTCLYTSHREMHPYKQMFIRSNDMFYLSISARNAYRLPYNVQCVVGKTYVSQSDMTDEQRRYIAKSCV